MKTHKASRKQEEQTAQRFGGTRNAGSGNGNRKNDVRTPEVSWEMKWTGKKQFTLKASELELAERHALVEGRECAFGVHLNGRDYVIISADYFEELTTDGP